MLAGEPVAGEVLHPDPEPVRDPVRRTPGQGDDGHDDVRLLAPPGEGHGLLVGSPRHEEQVALGVAALGEQRLQAAPGELARQEPGVGDRRVGVAGAPKARISTIV